MTLQRALGRAFFLAAACGGLQAALPAYPLGMVELAPLSLVLGLATAALLARGPWTLPAALVGLVAGGLLVGSDLTTLLRDALFIGLQASVARAWMQRGGDPDWLALDQGSRLRRLVLQAAPLAALTGVLLQGPGQRTARRARRWRHGSCWLRPWGAGWPTGPASWWWWASCCAGWAAPLRPGGRAPPHRGGAPDPAAAGHAAGHRPGGPARRVTAERALPEQRRRPAVAGTGGAGPAAAGAGRPPRTR